MSYLSGVTVLNGLTYFADERFKKKSLAQKKAKAIRKRGSNAAVRKEGNYYVVYSI